MNIFRTVPSYTRSCMTARGLFQNSRILCTQHQDNTRITDQKWKTVFRFPFISQAAAINKLKIYQAGFTILFVPLTYLAEANTIIPESSFLVALAIGLSGTITLSLVSIALSKIIGFIYINDLKNSVKISHLDFLGRRKNVELNLSEIIPFNEFKQQRKLDLYAKVRLYTSKKEYKIIYKYGGVKCHADFKLIFGETS